MDAKKKAIDLLYKFIPNSKTYYEGLGWEEHIIDTAKQCALIAVDEIQDANHTWHEDSIPYKYWEMVRMEIINI